MKRPTKKEWQAKSRQDLIDAGWGDVINDRQKFAEKLQNNIESTRSKMTETVQNAIKRSRAKAEIEKLLSPELFNSLLAASEIVRYGTAEDLQNELNAARSLAFKGLLEVTEDVELFTFRYTSSLVKSIKKNELLLKQDGWNFNRQTGNFERK